MSRHPALFTEADIKRAYRAAAAAGLPAPHIVARIRKETAP